ncbi:hypothetical protein JCM10908_003984 [Rhodotorula pacifica]|uniref:uncharacterized protein n=1 Tax=Rhodotorula pacifica TaxID=1495444 RepID=UPI00317409C4
MSLSASASSSAFSARNASTSASSPLAPPHSPTKANGAASTSNGTVLQGEGDLWSSILDSVKTTKAVQTKQCIVLGAPRSGKSSLVSRLRTTDGQLPPHLELDKPDAAGKGKALDLGMSYEVMDVRDEGDDGDTLGRLGFYQISTSDPARVRLVSLAISRIPLVDSLVVIVLDWQKPWTFVQELEYWIDLVEAALVQGSAEEGAADREEDEREEGKRTLEATLRAYQEPNANGAMPSTSSASVHAADAPLPAGTLLENLGLGLVIVCTKADQMNMLERDREFSEDLFDYVQQLIRTVALRYGAAVFYTSQTAPATYAKLRQYLLHRLFSPAVRPSLSSSSAPNSSSATEKTRAAPNQASRQSARASFPFLHRANVIDRDQVLVPAGWDTWGKIKILRERFDCDACGQSWEADLDTKRRAREKAEETGNAGEKVTGGLRDEYASVVVDFDARNKLRYTAQPIAPTGMTQAEDEQAFLRQHYEVLQAEVAKDPRLAFRQPVAGSMSSGGFGPSTVGPMAGSTLDLPTVASTLERAREAAGASARDSLPVRTDERYRTSMSRQNSGSSQPARSPQLGSSTSPTLPSAAAFLSRTSSQQSASAVSSSTVPTTQGSTSTAGNAAGGNQVLADFFQSLLTARTAGAAAPSTTTGATSSAPTGVAALRSSTRDGTTADATRREA